ncbi:MAG: DNA mismatch repair protein MutS [Alphaproteobacteria bacterium]|nr:DNA mismatch repair protein MutS [Alphaproteobacteria bacterium]
MEDNLFNNTKEATPMMAQYLTAKAQYPDCLLLFRMGDFYELFFDDAKLASSILSIALTHRGKHLNEDVPMCGVPVATMDNYVGRLVRAGYKVAICEQMETPEEAKKRGYKALVRRDISRIVTAGTVTEDYLLDSHQNNYLMAVVPDTSKKTQEVKKVSFAAIDISTGDFIVNTDIHKEFISLMNVYRPKEVLIPSSCEKTDFAKSLSASCGATITTLPDSKFNPIVEKDRLEKYFKVKTLDSFGIELSGEMSACGAVLEYLLITQRDNLSVLPPPRKASFSNYLVVDPATSKSLDIVTSGHGNYEYSLLGAIDKTKTPFGARLLAARVSMPVIDINLLNARLNCVDFFMQHEKLTESIRASLTGCPDLERAINRIRFNKFSPRDLGDIRESLRIILEIQSLTREFTMPTEGEYKFEKLKDFSELYGTLKSSLIESLSFSRENIIADGYSEELDKLKYIKNHSEDLIADLQAKYINKTGINTLKIRNNALIGWYIEIPLTQKHKVTADFIHKQTLISSIRYTTADLVSLQMKLIQAFDDWRGLEQKIYAQIVEEVLKNYEDISYAIKLFARLDVHTNFACIARERGYVRPEMTTEHVLEIEGGKHPVLALLEKDFTENDCNLDEKNRICLLTGPNMAGKSTYLRQNALIVILAQIGCYVPAQKAVIGIVDRLFSRVGASDDLARGRSTFMVEMIETATILNQATANSFVILDEVGRGTSTYDGLSIAWAVIENLNKKNKCRVLFATHYRELTKLQNAMPNIRCKTLKVQEWNGDVVFYHKIVDGIADKSYGIHVASIAGVPAAVIKRATELLKNFESQKDISMNFAQETSEQMDLLSYNADAPIKQKLAAIDPNNITPMEALNIICELKEMAD